MPISDNNILLQVNHLSTGYYKQQVLFDISFEVKRGEIVLLIGGNGSGKSTLLKAIYSLVTTGLRAHFPNKEKWFFSPFFNYRECIKFDNEYITCVKPYKLVKKGLVYVPQKNNTFEQLKVIENLEVVAPNLKDKAELKNRIDSVLEQLPQLTALKNRMPFNLSGGERQQLALGMALMQQPKMILLDEPSAGLSPNAFQKNLKIINRLNEQGITFLIVEHRIKEFAKNKHTILQMKLGRIITVNA
jgi:branched-chain amino acid transport system ATP-binding protein